MPWQTMSDRKNGLSFGCSGETMSSEGEGLAMDKTSVSDFESQLCVPQDSLEDLEFYPNFSDDWIPLSGLLLSPEHHSSSVDYDDMAFEKDFLKAKNLGYSSPSSLNGKHPFSRETSSEEKSVKAHGSEVKSEQEPSSSSSSKADETGTLCSGSLVDSDDMKSMHGKDLLKSNNIQYFFPSSINDDESLVSYEDILKGEAKFQGELSSSSSSSAEGTASKRKLNDDDLDCTKFLSPTSKKKPRSKHTKKKSGTQQKRICTHCQAEKTPQWRMGPMGPKTLCNACGVRHKAGKLFPEYRPAASPTFDSLKHSNFHKKVMQRRRQSCEDNTTSVAVTG